MNYSKEELARFQTLDEVEREIFTPEEIEKIKEEAKERSVARRQLSEQLSASLASYMAKEGIGFNELTRRLGVSPNTTSKVLKGDSNVTLETIALIAQIMHCKPKLIFSKEMDYVVEE